MPTTIYDSSLITQRRKDTAISGSFISRISPWNTTPAGSFVNQPNTGSAPLLGISEQSIINTVKNGQMTYYRKSDGGCVFRSPGCPCLDLQPTINISNNIEESYFYLSGTFQNNLEIIDSAGNVFPAVVNPVGQYTVYLLKYNVQGIPNWVTKIGAIDGQCDISVITYDNNNNLFVAGWANTNTIQFYNASNLIIPSETLITSGTEIIWLAKYNTNGEFQWATFVSSYGNFRPEITTDNLGNVYISGYFTPSLDIYENGNISTPVYTLQNIGNVDLFIVKYNLSGGFVWTTKIAGSNEEYSASIKCDNNNNLFVGGFYFSDSLGIYNANDPNAGTAPKIIDSLPILGKNYLVKYDSSGIQQWTNVVTGNTRRNNIDIDSNGNIYMSAFYENPTLQFYTTTADPPVEIYSIDKIGNSQNMYLAKYNNNGDLQWSANISSNNDIIQPYISIDKDNNIILAGVTENGANIIEVYNGNGLDPLSGIPDKTINLSDTNYNVFLVKFNPSGTSLWISYMGPTYATSRPAIDSSDNKIIVSGLAGRTGSNPLFSLIFYKEDGTPVPSLSQSIAAASQNTFIVMYDTNGTPIWSAQNKNANQPNITT